MEEENRTVICKMQKGFEMYASWCDLAQYDELCEKCRHNLKRVMSKYQDEKMEHLEPISASATTVMTRGIEP